MLKLCIKSIECHSAVEHQVLIFVNDGGDGTLEWVRSSGYQYMHSEQNIGICWALNALRAKVETDYIVYVNDDMYLLPGWDTAYVRQIEALPNDLFFLSSTSIQPAKPNRETISCYDYGRTAEEFKEQELLRDFEKFEFRDWNAATWPVNIVSLRMWDLVGGYSVEYSPGMYSDPDFSAKLYMAGVRYFKGLSDSRVYHFVSSSTGRVARNRGARQFLNKWGFTSGNFMHHMLGRGRDFTGPIEMDHRGFRGALRGNRLKRLINTFKSNGFARQIFSCDTIDIKSQIK